ncbi:MAG: ABC transporter ATP-binding protein [Desulfobacterales bacterium]|nr:ABC transporter ATP-binding protein [Desulfobacterales bacterium]
MDNRFAVEIRCVSKILNPNSVAAVTALDDVSLSIQNNEFFTLLGPSGCGKTTLLRVISGLEHPSDGRILLDNEDITQLPPHRRPVNMVFQNYALFPHLSVAQNISFGLEMLNRKKHDIATIVEKMLHLVHMADLAPRSVSQLSGGQAQRVALARALAPGPRVLLLDEPLSALDRKLRKNMQVELKRLQHETGVTFIFVTHDQQEALTMSDRIAVMNQGRILQVGEPQEIYDHPIDRFVAGFVGESNFIEAEYTGQTGDHEALVKLASGTVVTVSLPEHAPSPGPVTLCLRPEHAHVVGSGKASALQGRLENIVYVGTDTYYHLRLNDSEKFTTRQQNRSGRRAEFKVGDHLGVVIQENAVQILQG